MKILFIADGRSPTTRSWIEGIKPFGHELHLVTSYPCESIEGLACITYLPLAFSGVGKQRANNTGKPGNTAGGKSEKTLIGTMISRFRRLFIHLRYYAGPVSLWLAQSKYRRLVRSIHPDMVHALRVPFEGMMAAYTPAGYKLVISSWGNDFTLHAGKTGLMRRATRRAMRRVDGFTADCYEDIRLAREWGLRPDKPAIFAPGSGGLDLQALLKVKAGAVETGLAIINPRGIRPVYVMNDAFFNSLPAVKKELPGLKVYCAAMQGEKDAEKWVDALNLHGMVELLPPIPQLELWQITARCRLVVSPAIHDGTPNSVLEAMALGCLPVVGNIESLREWIKDGRNGILFDPGDPASIAAAIIRGLRDEELQQQAGRINAGLVAERADRKVVMPLVNDFYWMVFTT